jgi:hypothetical protein
LCLYGNLLTQWKSLLQKIMKRKVSVSRMITIALGSTNYVDLNIWSSAYTYFRYAFLQSRVAQSV